LSETAVGNDVECVPGSSCLVASDAENPNNVDSCVQRGLEGQPCTNDNDCDFNFYCDSEGDCTEKGDVGDGCSFKDPSQPLPDEVEAGCKSGLSCHPLDLVCVNNCTEGFTCEVDAQCPEGQSCVPVTVENEAAAFHL